MLSRINTLFGESWTVNNKNHSTKLIFVVIENLCSDFISARNVDQTQIVLAYSNTILHRVMNESIPYFYNRTMTFSLIDVTVWTPLAPTSSANSCVLPLSVKPKRVTLRDLEPRPVPNTNSKVSNPMNAAKNMNFAISNGIIKSDQVYLRHMYQLKSSAPFARQSWAFATRQQWLDALHLEASPWPRFTKLALNLDHRLFCLSPSCSLCRARCDELNM